MTLYDVIGWAPSYADFCEAWVEQQMLGHSGVYANSIAAEAATDFRATNDPNAIPAGVAVVWGAAPSNQGEGHTGISQAGAQVTSVWSNGAIVLEAIAQFTDDNAAPLVGYHNFGRGAPVANGGPAEAPGAAGPPFALPQSAAVVVVVAGLLAAADWLLS